MAKTGQDQHLKMSSQSHILFLKVFFWQETSKPPGKYPWQELFKSVQAIIFFWSPLFKIKFGSKSCPLPAETRGERGAKEGATCVFFHLKTYVMFVTRIFFHLKRLHCSRGAISFIQNVRNVLATHIDIILHSAPRSNYVLFIYLQRIVLSCIFKMNTKK